MRVNFKLSFIIKHIRLLVIVIFLTVVNNTGNAQKKQNVVRKQLFDYEWKFILGDYLSASDNEYNDNGWRNIDLPHDWSIEGEINPKNPSGGGGGYLPTGIGWYRKKFDIPASWRGKHISVYFEGVYMNSEVYLNGKSLGMHPYGYSSFFYDLTPYLSFGKENMIAVRIDNSQQANCRWYSGSGIYRHVWLYVTEPVHMVQWGVSITTPEINPENASVQIKTLVNNETGTSQLIILSVNIIDKNQDITGSHEVKVEIQANSEKELEQTITIKNPLLWEPEKPNLYQAQIKIMQENKTIDEGNYIFGIRSIKFSAEKGFQLNGKTVILNGGCIHHDNGCLGAVAYDRAEQRKAELLKSAGFNAVRTSHNPPSEAFLDACDRLGLLVIDEAFDGWKDKKTEYDYARHFDEWWQRDLESMVLRDRNHPSVILWSTGNEIIERKSPEAVKTARMLAVAVRNMDPARPVTSAMTTWDNEWEMFDPLMAEHDVCGYNYQLHRAQADHARVPSRIILQTESYPNDAFFCWDMIQNNSYIIGDFVWTALDYLGESGIGRWYYSGEVTGEHWERDLFPWHAAYCGDVDLTGWRKPISHYRNILYNNTEKLYMAVREPQPSPLEIKLTLWSVWPAWESWTWPGYEGKDLQVEVYSKYPEVRLYLNNTMIGKQPSAKEQEYKAIFTLPYSPGILKAVGVMSGQEMESVILQTSGRAAKIRLITDRSEIIANGQDLSFVTIEITDENEVIQPNAENQLYFTIEGPGVIAGVVNANIKDTDPYISDLRKTWKGRAMVVIKSTHSAGKIKFMVSSAGLKDAALIINAIEP